ncbi:MAG TPA: DUF3592 domain-containing protein [Micropepsaceae bacterium]|nr:DUF3592 domain-containing protein [Micropepsaceae bacterium]
MFEFIVSGIQAWNQVGLFAGAVIFLGIGGLLLGNSLYWRVHAIRATGTIIGVLKQDAAFFPVYRYQLPDGQFHEAKSDTGSGTISGKETGRVVSLMISAHNPAEAREAGFYLFDFIGVIFILPGIWLGYTALTAFPITRMTWVMAIVFLIHVAERLRGVFVPKGRRVSVAEWKQQRGIGAGATIDLSKVVQVESLRLAPEPAQTAQFANSKLVIPVLACFAVLLLAAGAYESFFVFQLESNGMRAPGEVVRLVESDSGGSGGYTYYPVVRFHTADNRTVEFKDSIGSNPPTRRPGDAATVLYLPAMPFKAMIDRGFLNFVIPALLLLGSGFLVWLLCYVIRFRKRAAAPGFAVASGAV